MFRIFYFIEFYLTCFFFSKIMKLVKNWDKIDVLKLSFFKNVNSAIVQQVIDLYNSYDEFVNSNLPANLNLIFNQGELFLKTNQKPEIEAENQIELCEKNKVRLVSLWDLDYPYYLKHIFQPPTFLFVKGELGESDKNAIAIVGTRKCSNYGRIQTERFAEYMAQRDIIVVSGLAYGIDTYAHKATIKAGGTTYAVIASGVDCLSPSTMLKNAEEIVDNGGAVISTFKCKTRALPPYFLHRNRIISGISRAVLVSESKVKGGALNTARFARDQNRDVYAIPGNLSSEQSQGTNKLILDSLAKLAYSPEYILKDIGITDNFALSLDSLPKIEFQSDTEKIIYESLSYEPQHIDEIINNTNLDTAQVMVDLLNLEFRNLIRQITGKNYFKL